MGPRKQSKWKRFAKWICPGFLRSSSRYSDTPKARPVAKTAWKESQPYQAPRQQPREAKPPRVPLDDAALDRRSWAPYHHIHQPVPTRPQPKGPRLYDAPQIYSNPNGGFCTGTQNLPEPLRRQPLPPGQRRPQPLINKVPSHTSLRPAVQQPKIAPKKSFDNRLSGWTAQGPDVSSWVQVGNPYAGDNVHAEIIEDRIPEEPLGFDTPGYSAATPFGVHALVEAKEEKLNPRRIREWLCRVLVIIKH
jgi:hypothetical protein